MSHLRRRKKLLRLNITWYVKRVLLSSSLTLCANVGNSASLLYKLFKLAGI